MRLAHWLLPAIALVGVLVLTGIGRLTPEACMTFLFGLVLPAPHEAFRRLDATPQKISVGK